MFVSLREKDMAQIILRSDAVGLMALDTYGELPKSQKEALLFTRICLTAVRFVMAVPRFREINPGEETLQIATSYPNTTELIMGIKEWPYQIALVLGGSVEAAPFLDPSIDAVIDLKESGQTLWDNELDVIWDGILGADFGMVWRQ